MTEQADLEALRSILAGPERARLDAVEARLHPDAQAASVAAAIEHLAQEDPKALGDVLYPVMGPAVAMAISDALRRMVESFNTVLQNTLSVRALRWRLEALRTGRPFPEVVLLRSLLYRVEQVFLVHQETGMLITHVTQDEAARDPDMVSGMLSALRDYVQDSFTVDQRAELDTLRVGDLTVCVEAGRQAYLAAVVRGNPPPELRDHLHSAMQRLTQTHARQIAEFDGDPEPLEASAPILETCLIQQTAELGGGVPWKAIIAIALLLGLFATWMGLRWADQARLERHLNAVRAEPGYVVTHVAETASGLQVMGLRDPLARAPGTLDREGGVEPGLIHYALAPYDARVFAERRARAALDPPPTVTLTFSEGVITARGAASTRWIEEARVLARALPGVNAIHLDEVRASDRAERVERAARLALEAPPSVTLTLRDDTLVATGTAPWWWSEEAAAKARFVDGVARVDVSAVHDARLDALMGQVRAAKIRFAPASAKIEATDRAGLAALVQSIRTLRAVVAARGQDLTIDVIGETDATGDPEKNAVLRAERAASAVALLRRLGAPDILRATALEGVSDERSVRFQVRIDGKAR